VCEPFPTERNQLSFRRCIDTLSQLDKCARHFTPPDIGLRDYRRDEYCWVLVQYILDLDR
jgi:hypothetical protein